MLKCSSERWVCAPQSLSAGTSTMPRLSVSFRMFAMGLSFALRTMSMGSAPTTTSAEASRPGKARRFLFDLGHDQLFFPVRSRSMACRPRSDLGDVDDSFGKGLRGFLRQIVSDTALDRRL